MIETITQPPHPYFIIFWGEACKVTHDYFVINGQLNNQQAPKQHTDRGYIYSKEVCGWSFGLQGVFGHCMPRLITNVWYSIILDTNCNQQHNLSDGQL